MDEYILKFIKNNITFCAKTANNCLHKHDLFRARFYSRNVTGYIIILEKFGYATRCECTNNINGIKMFNKIVINEEVIFERGVFMEKNEIIDIIKGIKETINASNKLIKTCVSIVDKMIVTPSVRPIIDDEYFGSGIAFDYNGENGFVVEIFVSDDEIWGYTSYLDNEESNFVFESENDAVNFWNIVVGKLS